MPPPLVGLGWDMCRGVAGTGGGLYYLSCSDGVSFSTWSHTCGSWNFPKLPATPCSLCMRVWEIRPLKVFSCIFENIIYTSFVLTKLWKSVEDECNFMTCKYQQCSVRLKCMVKLYVKVRIFHALKWCNAQNTEDKSGKHSRKILKLSHL